MMPHTAEQIRLPRALINQLMAHAQRASGREVCGFIASHAGNAIKTYPVANIAIPAEKRFQMEPTAQIRAIQQMREQGEEIFAIYHSHPTSPAAPSQADLDEFNYPEAYSLIISLENQGVLEIRGFRITQGQAKEITIVLS